ncbi:MAG TPA: hypothetical protein VJB90_02060 [Candidatus Nanoarchaeia archaeon]|nr:hypothetical protein [Candidatus Nanoarchaeia archaeon]
MSPNIFRRPKKGNVGNPSLDELIEQTIAGMVVKPETRLTLAETKQQFSVYMKNWCAEANSLERISSMFKEAGYDGICEDFHAAKYRLKAGRYVTALMRFAELLKRPFPGEPGYKQDYRFEDGEVVHCGLEIEHSLPPSRKTVHQLDDELVNLSVIVAAANTAISRLHNEAPQVNQDILGGIAEHYVRTQLSCQHLSGVYSCEQPITLSSTPRLDKKDSKLAYLFRIEGSCPLPAHAFEGVINMDLSHVIGYEPISVPGERPQ